MQRYFIFSTLVYVKTVSCGGLIWSFLVSLVFGCLSFCFWAFRALISLRDNLCDLEKIPANLSVEMYGHGCNMISSWSCVIMTQRIEYLSVMRMQRASKKAVVAMNLILHDSYRCIHTLGWLWASGLFPRPKLNLCPELLVCFHVQN